MTNIPIGFQSYQRRRANEPEIRFINRFYESDPTDQVNGTAAIRRPGLPPRIAVGSGPIRRIFTQSGFANDKLFIVSKNQLFNMVSTANDGDKLTLMTGTINGSATPAIVARKDYMFIADGIALQYTDGTGEVLPIAVPDDLVISSLAVAKEFVFCTVENDDKFFWIQPGETTIDPLNFATAESSPDILLQAMALGDNVWFLGKDSTEVWYFTGDLNAPIAPITGRPYDRGVWGGTGVRVNDQLIVVGSDGRVYAITDGADPISDPGIEERIVNAMKIEQLDL